MEICREYLYAVLRYANKNPSRIGACDTCEIDPMDCKKETLDHHDTDRIISALNRVEEADALIKQAIEIMSPEQVSQWERVRTWQEGYETLKILKEETYRNQPYVNITDNMVRVTLTCSRNEWYRIKRHLTIRSSGRKRPRRLTGCYTD